MKQGSLILIVVIALFIGGFWVKKKLNEIEIEFQTVRFLNISKTSIFGEFTIKVAQSFGDLDISDLKLNFYLDGKYISAIQQFEPNSQQIGNDIFITGNFNIDPTKVFSLQNVIGSLANISNNTYTIKGELTVKKLGITAKLPIEQTGTFKSN